MLKGLFFLLLFQFAGELIVRALRLPLSGPICGMALLLAWLSLPRKSISASLGNAADSILANMPILFVPVGVGVMVYWDQLSQNILAIGITLIASTLIGLGVTAFTFRTARHWRGDVLPTLAIVPMSLSPARGRSGVMNYTFAVTRSGNLTGTSSVRWSVAGTGTHKAIATDFGGGAFSFATVIFAPGETSKTLIVQVNGDTNSNPEKSFTVTLAGAVGAIITTATATAMAPLQSTIPTGGLLRSSGGD